MSTEGEGGKGVDAGVGWEAGGGGVKLAPIKPSHQFFERVEGKSIFSSLNI